jgi:hypothetical protein
MNVEIGTETPIFLFWEYLFRNYGILSLQCSVPLLQTSPVLAAVLLLVRDVPGMYAVADVPSFAKAAEFLLMLLVRDFPGISAAEDHFLASSYYC